MEEMNNNLEVLTVVEEEETTPVYEENENEVELVAEEHSSNLIVVGTGLAIAAVAGGAFLMKKFKAKKKAKIEKEANDRVIEILKANGKTDEEIVEFLNTMDKQEENKETQNDNEDK